MTDVCELVTKTNANKNGCEKVLRLYSSSHFLNSKYYPKDTNYQDPA